MHRFKPSHDVIKNFDVDGNVGRKSVETGDNGLIDFAGDLPNDCRGNSIFNALDSIFRRSKQDTMRALIVSVVPIGAHRDAV